MKRLAGLLFIMLTVVMWQLGAFPEQLHAQAGPVVASEARQEKVWTVRVSSFSVSENAWDLVSYLKELGYSPVVVHLFDSKERLWYVVQIGDYPTRSQAKLSGKLFKKKTGLEYLVRSISTSLLNERTAASPDASLPVLPAKKTRVRNMPADAGRGLSAYASAPLLGTSEEFFYELDQRDVLRAVSERQRQVILARIMIRRGYVDDGIKFYEKLLIRYPKDLELREEYIGVLLDNGDYEKASSLLNAWLEDEPDSPRALRQDARLRLLTGDYDQQQNTLGYLLRLRPGDTDSISARAYGRQQGGDWLGAIESFSELVDKEPQNADARRTLSQLLRERRPRLDFEPSVYLQSEDTITTTLATRFAMQLDHVTRGEVYYANTRIYRPEKVGVEGIDKDVNQVAFLFKRDLTRTFTAIAGIGAYEGTASGASGVLGFEWQIHDPGTFSAMIDYNNPWLDEPSAANYEGRYNQLSLTYNGFYNDTWGLFLNGQIRQYVVDNDRLYGTKGLYNIILTRRLLADPDLFISYSFYRSYFEYDDENYTPFTVVENESIHTLSASFSKSICDTVFIEAAGGVRADEFKTSLSYFGGPGLILRLGKFEFNTGYEYSSDSGLAGGGETQLIRGGFSFVF